MQVTRILAAVAAFSTAALLIAAPAFAQATRTWVSGVGDDANPCSRTAPCKTFAGAIPKTAAGGEIECLDPGGFGAVTITKALTIDCEPAGGVGGVLVAGTNAIVINISTGDNHVQLIGLDIDGLGANGAANSGLNGINVLTAANVAAGHCLIYGFQSQGVTGGAAGVRIGAGATKVQIINSIIRQNTNGVVLSASGANAVLDHTELDSNVTANLVLSTAGTNAFLHQSTLTNTPVAISNTGGAVFSTVTNFIRGTGAPTNTNPLQ